MAINEIISSFREELKWAELDSTIKNLVKTIHIYPDEPKLLELLFEFFDEFELRCKHGRYIIFDLMDLRGKVSQEYAIKLCLLEASLRRIYQDPQTTWETLAAGLILSPDSNEILIAIEELNEDPSEAPAFSDCIENIADMVAKNCFPKDTFEYLLLICANPQYPDVFDLAKKIASKSI